MTSSWDRAARVVRRASFAASGADIDAVAAAGVENWVGQHLDGTAWAAAADRAEASAPQVPLPVRPGKDAPKDEKQAARKAAKEGARQAMSWWLGRMIDGPDPVAEKVTFGWHDHWATSVRKVKAGRLMLDQNLTLRRLGLGPFRDLAHALLTDPALMVWLDAPRNTAKAPNENLAREVMELFTLGQGRGYTEDDVKEAARALTGWRVTAGGTAEFVARRHDTGSKTILGTTGDLGLQELLTVLLAREEHPRHLATRWWQRLAAADPPAGATLDRLTKAYGTGHDSGALLRAILVDEDFMAGDGTVVAGPLEWLVTTARTLKVPSSDATLKAALGSLTQLGQTPMLPPDVAGWPRGAAWLTTSSAGVRFAVSDRLVRVGDLSPVADAAPSARVDAALHLFGIARVSERTATALAAARSRPADLVATLVASPEYLVI